MARHSQEPKTASPATQSRKERASGHDDRRFAVWGLWVWLLRRTQFRHSSKGSVAVIIALFNFVLSGLTTHSPIDVSALGSQASSAWTSLALVLSLEGSHNPNSLELGWFGLSAPLSLSPQDTILYGTCKLFVGHNYGGFIISFCVKQKHSLSSCRAFCQPSVSVSLSCLVRECR